MTQWPRARSGRGRLNSSSAILFRSRDGAEVEAQILYAISPRAKQDFKKLWRPAAHEGIRRLIRRRLDPEHWPTSLYWDWPTKITDAAERADCIACRVSFERKTQGFVTLKLRERSRRRPSKFLVYVEYLQVAPWNDGELFRSPRYKGVGTALVSAAVRASFKLDYRGRVGLHCLPARRKFYEKLGFRATRREKRDEDHIYLELSEERAAEFVTRSK